jgi:hypothetical protein
MDLLVGKHPLAQALVRNRKAEVGGFTKRDAHTVPVTLEDEELSVYQEVTEYLREGYNRARADKNHALGFVMVTYQKMLASSSHAIRQSFGRRITKLRQQLRASTATKVKQPNDGQLEELRDAEEATAALGEFEDVAFDVGGLMLEIDQLERLVDRLGKLRDSKAAEVLAALDKIFDGRPNERVLIFTQFIETQTFLAAALRQNSYSVSVFNGQMNVEEKEESVQRFRETDQILISTEAGGEGRNFQFCHLMVNYDLPWNPMKVEQRIGRLDRIGQKHPVQIYNLFCEETVEERVLDVLAQRIGLFEESVGSLDPILGEVERDIERLVLSDAVNFDAEFVQYEEMLQRRVLEAREKERTLADFVLDRASLRRDTALQLLQESPLARWTDLEQYAEACLPYYGGTIKEHYEGGAVVSLSPRLLARLRQRQSTIRGTFDPEVARQHEELPFFAFGHWLVDALAELPLTVDPVTTGARRGTDVPPGDWVEIYYEIRGEAVRPTGRFIRHLIGPDLVVRSEDVRAVPTLGEPLARFEVPSWAADAVTASQGQFETEYLAARAEMREGNEAARDEALERADRIFRYQRIRLTSRIEEEEAWIREKEAAGSDRDKRILPARRGQLAKKKERLSTLVFEHEIEVETIQSRRPTASAAVLAAGVVVGS